MSENVEQCTRCESTKDIIVRSELPYVGPFNLCVACFHVYATWNYEELDQFTSDLYEKTQLANLHFDNFMSELAAAGDKVTPLELHRAQREVKSEP